MKNEWQLINVLNVVLGTIRMRFPVLRLNFNRKHIPFHPVGLREGMQIRNWMRVNFPEFRKLSQDKIEKYSKELVEKAIIN